MPNSPSYDFSDGGSYPLAKVGYFKETCVALFCVQRFCRIEYVS